MIKFVDKTIHSVEQVCPGLEQTNVHNTIVCSIENLFMPRSHTGDNLGEYMRNKAILKLSIIMKERLEPGVT